MRWTLGSRTCLLGLTAFFFTACGQNEGGRCQINSDCGSGLYCYNGTTGNGICKSTTSGNTTSDASMGSDTFISNDERSSVSVDEGSSISVDEGSEETAMPSSQVDAEPAFSPATSVDGAAIDSIGLD